MGNVHEDAIIRYGLAVAFSGAALALVLGLDGVLSSPPRVFFAASVALASRYGGRGPAALAALLGVAGIEISFATPLDRVWLTHPQPLLNAAAFGLVAFAIDSSSEGLRRARAAAEQHARELATAYERLGEHMEEVQALSEHLQDANTQLSVARDEAVTASRAREEVLAVVAHDLRNPLNLVTMTTQLITEIEPAGEQRKKLFDVMHRAAQRMNRLIEDLLDVVRIDTGRLTLDARAVPAGSTLANTLEMFELAAREKGVSLTARTPDPDLCVRADAERVVQAMGNIVGNALKFVGRGGRVRISCCRQGPNALFAIKDTGPGMTPEQMTQLFNKFWQGRRTDKRGVGLGLTIARGIVEAHGGRIWAKSRVGVGSIFYFTLPIDLTGQQAA
jgi:signal transduction histidine kinase